MTQRVLILGGSGFIGSRIVAALQSTDWATVIAPRHRNDANGKGQPILDATDPTQIAAALEGVSAVINAVSGNANTIRSNAMALFAAASTSRTPPRIIYLSSMTVYGDASGLVDEAVRLRGRNGYAGAKIAAEQIASGYRRSVILRPGCVYGRGSPQWTSRIEHLLIQRRLGDLGAYGDGCTNLIHIDDLVAAIVNCILARSIDGEIFNLGMPSPPTWNAYFSIVARSVGAPSLRTISLRRLLFESYLVAPLLKLIQLAARVVGRSETSVPQPLSPSLLKLFRQTMTLDSRKAQQKLGLSCAPSIAGQSLRYAANLIPVTE